MERSEEAECPFCLGPMDFEDREGVAWLVCPNGCATEIEAPVKKPAEIETMPPLQARAAGQ